MLVCRMMIFIAGAFLSGLFVFSAGASPAEESRPDPLHSEEAVADLPKQGEQGDISSPAKDSAEESQNPPASPAGDGGEAKQEGAPPQQQTRPAPQERKEQTGGASPASLLKAVERGSVALFDEEMEKLLRGPFSHWAKALFETDDLGQNIFHKASAVQRNRSAFAERMKMIIELISPSSSKITSLLSLQSNYSLSGVSLFQPGEKKEISIIEQAGL